MKLIDILKRIQQNQDYPINLDWHDQNLYESYAIVSELLDPSNAYQYQKVGKTTWSYEDVLGNTFYAKLAYIPKLADNQEDYIELKTFWIDDSGKPQYSDFNTKSTSQDLHKRSDTIAKIYRDEIIPFFINQSITNQLRIVPVDKVRYRLSKMMASKYTPSNMTIDYLNSYIKIVK
jgi:hypothetical protein